MSSLCVLLKLIILSLAWPSELSDTLMNFVGAFMWIAVGGTTLHYWNGYMQNHDYLHVSSERHVSHARSTLSKLQIEFKIGENKWQSHFCFHLTRWDWPWDHCASSRARSTSLTPCWPSFTLPKSKVPELMEKHLLSNTPSNVQLMCSLYAIFFKYRLTLTLLNYQPVNKANDNFR